MIRILYVLAIFHMMCNTVGMKSYQSGDARLKMREILTAVERGEHIGILRYDTPTAIVVPPEWYEHTRAALAAFGDSGDPAVGGDPPVSANEVRKHIVTLAALLDGMRKYIHPEIPESVFTDYWGQLNAAVAQLADLLPENAEG